MEESELSETDLDKEIKKREIAKLDLEVRKLSRPIFLKPEFLGLVIPFIAILVTYFINREDIHKALELREKKIALENTILKVEQSNLRKQEQGLRDTIENLNSEFLLKQKQLEAQFKVKEDSVKASVDSLGAHVTTLQARKTELEAITRNLSESNELVLTKNYVHKICNAMFFNLDNEFDDFIALLRDPMTKASSRKKHLQYVQSVIDTTSGFRNKIRLKAVLIYGNVDKYQFGEKKHLKELKSWLAANPKKITPKIMDDLTSRVFSGRDIFSSVELIVQQHREGKLSTKIDQNELLTMFEFPTVFYGVNHRHGQFKHLENYLYLLEIAAGNVNSILPKQNLEGADKASVYLSMSALRNLAPLTYCSMAAKAILECPHQEDFIIYSIRGTLDRLDLTQRDLEKYSIPRSTDVEQWRKWTESQKEAVKLWTGPKYPHFRDDPTKLYY